MNFKKIETLEDLQDAFDRFDLDIYKNEFANQFWTAYSRGQDYYYIVEEVIK